MATSINTYRLHFSSYQNKSMRYYFNLVIRKFSRYNRYIDCKKNHLRYQGWYLIYVFQNIFTVLVTICALINEGIILTKIWYDEERGIEYNKSGLGIKTLYLASIFGTLF